MKAHVARASALPQRLQEVPTHAAIVERRGSGRGDGEHLDPGGLRTGDLPPSGDLDGAETTQTKAAPA